MFRLLRLFAIALLVILHGACTDEKTPHADTEKQHAVNSMILSDSNLALLPSVKARMLLIEEALKKCKPVLLLDHTDSAQAVAQALALNDAKFCENLFDKQSRQAFRNEIFNVYPARPHEIPVANQQGKVYKVEMYNYALNMSTTALIDVKDKKVLSVNNTPQTQPDITPALKDLAIQIAIHHPEVTKALGFKPNEQQALMANTKTALNNTRCERSLHLCVAPTFTQGDRALWVIVDLTDFKIVGIRWTNTGREQTVKRVSEKQLKFDKIMECYCKQITSLKKDQWKLNYVITTSDGLRISEVFYNDQLMVNNAKVVDWHVNYSNTEGFGYSDAVGCPEFSQSAVVAVSEPRVSDIIVNSEKIGFALEQNFSSAQWPQPCNYNYLQRYEFYKDGRFRTAVASLGRGCGNNGTYRPVIRINFAGNEQQFAQWNGKQWVSWQNEQWVLQDFSSTFTSEGYLYKVSTSQQTGFYVEPARGQFKDGGRGDNAYTYVSKLHPQTDEGENDLVTIGPCCNTNFEQGPEKFLNQEPLQNGQIIFWYVPQIKNDDTKGHEYCWAESYLENGVYKTHVYPCIAGPMFIPYGYK